MAAVIDPTPEWTRDRIARRAYELYQQRHEEHGHDLEDWLEAERQLTDARGPAADVQEINR